MNEKTAWSHLPNGAHIDRILESVKAHPKSWDEAKDAAWDPARAEAWNEARKAARVAGRGEASDLAWDAAREVVLYPIAALIAWDHSVQYLDMPSDQLKVWSALSEDPACILLLQAIMAFEKINELEIA